eukprot:1138385-Pelagomonas_calceolata.AAC.1
MPSSAHSFLVLARWRLVHCLCVPHARSPRSAHQVCYRSFGRSSQPWRMAAGIKYAEEGGKRVQPLGIGEAALGPARCLVWEKSGLERKRKDRVTRVTAVPAYKGSLAEKGWVGVIWPQTVLYNYAASEFLILGTLAC